MTETLVRVPSALTMRKADHFSPLVLTVAPSAAKTAASTTPLAQKVLSSAVTPSTPAAHTKGRSKSFLLSSPPPSHPSSAFYEDELAYKQQQNAASALAPSSLLHTSPSSSPAARKMSVTQAQKLMSSPSANRLLQIDQFPYEQHCTAAFAKTFDGHTDFFNWVVGIVLCLKPADRWALAYLIATLPLCFIAESVSEMVWTGILLRLVLIPTVCFLRYHFAQPTSFREKELIRENGILGGRRLVFDVRILYFALDFYVAALFIYLYAECASLIQNNHGSLRYDNEVIRMEKDIFAGMQPARDLRLLIPGRALGEYLHFCYFAYYFIIGASVAVPYFFCPRESFDRTVSAMTLCFFTCYAFYLVYPVEGPYWRFDRPDPEEVSYFFVHVVRWVLVGSSKGTAMPSGHCAISVVCWIASWAYHLRLALILAFLVPGLVTATVWCGFHYGLDAMAGVSWGICTAAAGILLAKFMPYHKPAHDTSYSAFRQSRLNDELAKWI
ncbi:hypothetical protein QOT17_016470 [Balamuthia mandrillaris]